MNTIASMEIRTVPSPYRTSPNQPESDPPIRTASPQPETKPLPPERLAPHSPEIEEVVLGSILINAAVLPLVRAVIATDDFFILKHQRIWSVMIAIADRGDTVDDLVLIDELEARKWLDEIGGAQFITRLINNTPSYLKAVTYANVIQRCAIRRRLIAAAGDIAQAAQDDTLELPEVLERTESLIAGPIQAFREKESVTVTGLEVVKTAIEQIATWYADPQSIRGWRTGIGALDRALGGVENGAVFLAFGHTGHGKSLLLIQMMLALLPQLKALDPKARALCVPTEMTKEQYIQRMIAFQAHTDPQTIKSGYYPEITYRNVIKAASDIETLPMDFIASRPTPEQLYALCEARKKQGAQLLFIDSIHELGVERSFAGSGVYERVTHTIEKIQELAQALNLAVFCTAHINRDSKERLAREPILQDLTGSARIEDMISYGLSLYRPGNFLQKGVIDKLPDGFADADQTSLRICKNRFGNDGARIMLTFKHIGHVYGFYEQEQNRFLQPSPAYSNPSDKEDMPF